MRRLPAMSGAVVSLAATGCPPARDCGVDLWYVDGGQAGQVEVMGDWNGWSGGTLEEVEPGAWTLRLDLDPGEYEYLFRVDGREETDRLQPLLSWDPALQVERSLLRIDDCAAPALEVESASAQGGDLRVVARFLRGDGGRLSEASATLTDGTRLDVQTRPARGELIVTGELAQGKHTVLLTATDGDGADVTVRLPLWVEDEPFSWEGAIVYQVLVDRFAGPEGALPDDPDTIGLRHGGDLAGLTAVLRDGYFDALSVDALWISPLYDNPQGLWEGRDGRLSEAYHGYWPASPDAVEPAFGTEEDVRAFVEEAHAHGIRVIMDVVPNHVHEDHTWWLAHGDDGWFHEEPDCICGNYECPWSSDIETCWFTDFLPDLALERPDVSATVVDSTLDWATRFDLDGFRVDAVPMMPRAAVRDLVAGITTELEQGPTRFYTVGETYTGADGWADIRANLGPFGLDGQFDFPVMWALRGFVAWQSVNAADLAAAIEESEAQWAGSGSVMAPFVGNHDMPRFLSEAAGDATDRPWDAPPPQPDDALPYERLLLAQAVVLTLPGAPVLYYGDEVGLAGANDPDCRRPMVFDDLSEPQQWLLDRTRRVAGARRQSEALRLGDRRTLVAEGSLYAHLRDAGDGAPAVTAINASSRDQVVTITIPADVRLAAGTPFGDVVEGSSQPWFTPGEPVALTMPAWSARVWIPRGDTP